ncbi:unnamed protein product [Phytomonas sp. EM1]|nr:unnamed protein product [Phytomonas sp. EM1]|eukprot:CCW62742.1 unnamed protein product [Phytomonas sp. isolate EM1]
MTKEVIVASCKANGGYESPKLNDQLFLHCKGFVEIKNLEPYTNVKVLWLEQNAITNLSGLEHQRDCLVSLFLQNNTICSLQTLTATPLHNLRVLNISHNYITSLKGIAAACPCLETLQVSHNHLVSLDACRDLWQLSETLTSVDLSYNKITQSETVSDGPVVNPFNAKASVGSISDSDIHISWQPDNGEKDLSSGPVQNQSSRRFDKDPLVVVHFFKNLPNVSVVYIHGNGITHGLKNYRRNMVLHLPNLTYLDERPVFPEERRVVEAWGRGGDEAEAAERAAIREEKREHLKSCVSVLTDRLENSREARDRLTKIWEQQREEELRALERKREGYRDACNALEAAERSTREANEKDEQNARWDLEALFEKVHESLLAHEEERLRAYQQAEEIRRVTIDAACALAKEAAAEAQVSPNDSSHHVDDVVASSSSFTTDPLNMLLHSDDDILREMEDTIQHVLYDVELSVRSYGNSARPEESPKQLVMKSAAAVNAAEKDEEFDYCNATEAIITASFQHHDRATEKAERATHDAIKRFGTTLCQGRREELWKKFQRWEKPLEHI